MYQIFDEHIQVRDIYICTTHEANGINNATSRTVYIDLTYITKKYCCHIANITHITKILHQHIDLTFLHTYQNTINCNSYFTWYFLVCARNKYAHQIGHATYELTGIPHVTRSSVHRWQQGTLKCISGVDN